MKPALFLFLYLFASIMSFGQDNKNILADIKSKYLLIRELIDSNTLRQKFTDYNCTESSEKGTLTFYYNSNELKHIIHEYRQSHISYTDEFYIWDDQLFFEFSTHKVLYKDYERSGVNKIREVDVILTLEERLYFDNLIPIKCLFKDYETRSNSSNNPKTSYIRNQVTNCDQADKIISKYKELLKYQNTHIENACTLPKSISKIISNDVIYSTLGQN